jgi:hypothetical protein
MGRTRKAGISPEEKFRLIKELLERYGGTSPQSRRESAYPIILILTSE